MPLADPSAPPTFSEVYRLLEVSPRDARFRHVEACSKMATCEGHFRYAIANARFDRGRVATAHDKLQDAKRKEVEAKFVLVLLEDMAFRRELINLDSHWRRFRMSHMEATNDRFVDVVMGAPEEQTVELRASWKTICDIIASKVTAASISAKTL